MDFNFKRTPIQVWDDAEEIVIQKGYLIEEDGICAIYDGDEKYFKFVCTSRFELDVMFATQELNMKEIEEDARVCSECGEIMLEGFYFESDGTMYCSEKCLLKVITWSEYLLIHDNGNGDAYWTEWD